MPKPGARTPKSNMVSERQKFSLNRTQTKTMRLQSRFIGETILKQYALQNKSLPNAELRNRINALAQILKKAEPALAQHKLSSVQILQTLNKYPHFKRALVALIFLINGVLPSGGLARGLEFADSHSGQYSLTSVREDLTRRLTNRDNLSERETRTKEINVDSLVYRVGNITISVSEINNATSNFDAFVLSRTKLVLFSGQHFLLGPNFDGAYKWRLGPEQPSESREIQISRKEHFLELGLPDIEALSQELRDHIRIANYITRARELEQHPSYRRQIFVLKHFPGGERVEDTEFDADVVFGDLQQARETYMRPFVNVIQSRYSPKGIMLGHTVYEFEEELRQRYPELERYYGASKQNLEHSASLSPAIVRGLLRRELGYNGLIIGDWYIMDGLRLNGVSGGKRINPVDLFVSAVKAGVNLIPGLDLDAETEYRLVENIYRSDPVFRDSFDNGIRETVLLLSKHLVTRASLPFNADVLEITDLYKLDTELTPEQRTARADFLREFLASFSFEDQIKIYRFLYAKEQGAPDWLRQISNLFPSYNDIWNREGVLTVVFMKCVIEQITGKRWPYPKSIENEEKWVRELMRDPIFVNAYRAIDWNNPVLQRLYNHTSSRMLTE